MSKNRFFAGLGFVLALAACLAYAGTTGGVAAKSDPNGKLAFEKLKGLVGEWEANSTDGTTITFFELVAGGTAVLERTRIPGHTGEMVTVYHLDGDRLLLTHYCEAGNQPRMQAEPFDPASNEIRFNFVGGTNLASVNAGHMHNVLLTFAGPNEVNADWAWQENGKTGFHAQMQYHRVR